MSIEKMLNRIAEQKKDLDAEAAILLQLPEDTKVTSLFSSNGIWHLHIGASAEELLETFVPLNSRMTLTNGTWVAMCEHTPLDWNQPILGIWGDNGGIHWYHELSGGDVIRVRANVGHRAVPGYEIRRSAHSFVWARIPVPLAVEFRLLPQQAYDKQWADFMTAEGFDTIQKLFVYAMKAVVQRDWELKFDMLPIPAAADVMKVGDDVLQVWRGAGNFGPVETYPEGSPLAGFERIGQFWQYFSREQAERIVTFAQANRCNVERLQTEARNKAFDSAKQALLKLQETHLTSVANSPESSVLERWVQQETGYAIGVTLRDEVGYRTPGRYSLWLTLDRFHEGAQLQLPVIYDRAGFNFQEPAFYEYVPNKGRFSDATTQVTA